MKKHSLLTKKEIGLLAKTFPEWKLNARETEIQRTYGVEKYIDGLVLIARIVVHAEILNHHPVIEYTYGRVKVRLSTHSMKGITKLDAVLLERIERIAQGVRA